MVKTNIQTFSGEVEILSNLHVGNYLTANGTASNVLDITGNVGATFFVGDGGFLSNIATTLNDIVANPGGNTVSNTLVFESGADVTSNTAIVTYANVGISISNTEPTGEFQLSIGSNIFVNTHAANVLTVVGAIGSDLFIGDGGLLSNIATTIDQIIDQGNTVSNTLQLISGMDATSNTGLVTHKDVGISISNTAPTGEFQFGVGSNLFVNTYSSNVLSIEGNVNAQKMTLGTISVTSAYGLNHVTAQGSATGDTISLSNVTTGLEVTSNITAGGNVTAETVITSANVEVGNRLKFASNVFVDDLRIADLAANLVTYDKTTGELMDSGGLFANKLAVVSVQPPSVLTANATTIAKHGTYTVTTSSLAENSNAWNAFDGDSAVEWTSSPTVGHLYSAGESTYAGTSNLFTGNYIQPGVSSAGEWLAVEFPYKTTLRHMKLTPPATLQRYPASANVYATNDSLTWTEVAQWGDVDPVTSSNVQTVVVNATESFKKYAMVVTKANGGADNVALAKWDLFAESFSIDGGQISMAQQPTTGGETMMDQHGPHGRGEAKLKKYPEIAFISNEGVGGTYDRYLSSTAPFEGTFIQAGYIASSSSNYGFGVTQGAWNLFAHRNSEPTDNYSWYSQNATNYNGTVGGNYSYSGTKNLGTGAVDGEWVKIEMPEKIRLKKYTLWGADLESEFPQGWTLYGSDNGTSWASIHSKDGQTIGSGSWSTTSSSATGKFVNLDVTSSDYYKYFALVFTRAGARNDYIGIGEWELYGYEEDPPLGDTSVDTTFTSIMNTPQTTGAQVYVDGNLGETFTNRVTGPTVSNTHTTYVSADKYWELSGNVESNVTLEANTFLSGDAPHSLSMWFNSSNLEANVSNSCIFSLATEEKLDSVNLDLQSNTWHNLTYAYQGEGGSRVTYLDGRKVAEDQAEDTFGEYPPFAMTGYSQGGYVVSASSEYESWRAAWEAFDDNVTSADSTWTSANTGSANRKYDSSNGGAARVPPDVDAAALTIIDGISTYGEWVQLEFPYKMNLSSILLYSATHPSDQNRWPKDATICASNDDFTWTSIGSWVDELYPGTSTSTFKGKHYILDNTKTFKYVRIVITKVHETTLAQLQNVGFYGHRENDLVRLPDPTNVLKYPHVVMTGPAQRGYVVSASDFNTSYPAWGAFDDKYTDLDTVATSEHVNSRWQPKGGYAISGTPRNADGTETTTLASGSSPPDYDGEWLQLESPNKVNITSYRLYNSTDYVTDYNAHTVVLLGSNTGIDDWVDIGSGETVLSWSPNASTPDGTHTLTLATVNTSGNTGFYKYHRLVVTKVVNQNLPVIYQLQLFGTGVDSVPLQIGGGNIDKVANFRVYDKFVGEDQALEIWDAQKDTFRGVKNSVTLHKGRLGIGTTEPEGRLAVLDEPDPTTYGLQEFPPKPLAGYKTYFEGHGEFCASASVDSSPTFYPSYVFDKNVYSIFYWDAPLVARYSSVSPGNYLLSNRLAAETQLGEYLVLKLPYKIKLEHFTIQRQLGGWWLPQEIYYYAKSEYEDTWEQIYYHGSIFGSYSTSGNSTDGSDAPIRRDVNSNKFYRYFALVITKGNGGGGVSLADWRLFGYREQLPPKQSVLHDGQLTLTKNLTVPRIGPALDADDTPRRDRLVVEYNTSTNPTFDGAVRDTSGRGNDALLIGTSPKYYANEKYLQVTTAGDAIQSLPLNNPGGAYIHSFSIWFKMVSIDRVICQIGADTQGVSSGLYINNNNINYYFFGNDRNYSVTIGVGSWNHIVATYDGGTLGGSRRLWFNGEEISSSNPAPTTTVAAANIEANTTVRVGSRKAETNVDSKISNFKLYDVALTAEEAKTLYDMGRCDEGHHVVNFSKTRVGIGLGDGEAPTYTLDVRGQIRSDGSLVTSFTGQHKCIPDEPMEKGLIVSAKKNQFVKLNGLAIGKSAITIDESLPIVSLSNVAQDKACFGVVSSTEEANTTFRVETTNGGVISTIPKTLGDNRAIVNSVGEGAIWVVNTGGSLESGDYITTSNVVGYGQKQDDDVLHNYTVAKITMDCDFTASNVAVQTIKREETGLQTIMEDTWNQLVEYDRSSNTETQYSNTLAPSAYTDQPGYTPRKVTTIVDYTDGSNLLSIAEWSNLESNIQNTYQSNTFTEIVDYTKFVSFSEWSNLTTDVQNTYSEAEITTYYQIQRGENVLDENGQLQFEDKTGATEAPYERRFLDASGAQTDSANAVHIAAFVGCTYHCG
jgi:hypothetical protein